MKPLHIALAAGGLLLIVGCATMASPRPVRAPQPARPIEPNGFYVGRWYEIARTPMKLTDGCVAGYTDYITRGDKLIERDGCRDKTPMGKEKVVAGPLTILNPGQNTKVRVNYRLFGFVPVARTYWMLDHGQDWFIMSDPALENVNVYTRDPRPSREVVAMLNSKVSGFGYDVGKLEYPETFPLGMR